MKWYKINVSAENRVWRKCVVFAERFVFRNKEVHFSKVVDLQRTTNYRIHALVKDKGDIAKSISSFEKERMPEFAAIRHLILFRENILNDCNLSTLNGVVFKKVMVEGEFPLNDYRVLCFNEVIDCIDKINSVRAEFDFLSTLVLDGSQMPQSADGFFLKNWNRYGFYETIVNERVREQLLTLYKVKDFLIFEEMKVTDNLSVTNTFTG